ncbi:hypothetical protein MFLAVUS_010257 [Mucor flavus]|uniref:CBM21 domain-containing protein n=1 Tax=Mucor flavus TaxID=439312 RepID=A0ABP9ZC67_9FUNG
MLNNNKKRVTLNRRSSSLLLDYQAMVPTTDKAQEERNGISSEYTRQLVASALSSSVQIATQQDKRIELPLLLKSSLRTPRSASAPCSPTTGLKSVHFNKDNLEDVCLFRKAQTPLAISQKNIFWGQDEQDDDDDSSSSSSCSSSDEEEDQEKTNKKSLVFTNWPTRLSDLIDKKTKVIRIEKSTIQLLDHNKLMTGKILVRNLDYHKTVTIRYSFDFWETIENCEAKFKQQHDHKNNNTTYDVFTFNITVPTDATNLYLAVNYKVGSKDFWDNNDGRNYEIQINNSSSANKKILKNKLEKKEDGLKARYDFGQSIHRAIRDDQAIKDDKSSPVTIAAITTATTTAVQRKQIPKASVPIPIPMIRRKSSSSPTGLSCHSPLASSPTFMDLNSQSYMDLVNKYCFYSTSPSRSPMSING